ncbi:CheY-P-specific phosphatase CheC [Sporanaerobium hydrogeniformans]|uniref:CheY-P-specific phosphatase CheC n=1 Tax=Sporanaerobium hydrogeniformans TaxID=3072179 RepID=A0AC61DFU2_9FIRM|nr:chemotaxis protein CheC [Sporanaerobium hydrogeniformans]PHV71765.1 CheY-P-specific phosphatase CheC [Sporanaerobium hydrogeniformans]
MKERDYRNLTNEELDIIREAGNIGAGNAMTSLGKLVGRTLDISITEVHIEKIQELGSVLGDPEKYIAGMLINVHGDLNAMLLLALETESAIKMVNLILNKNVTSVEEFDEMDLSVLCETGNILGGSYVNALNSLTGLDLDVSIPQMAIDMAGAILSYPAIEFARNDNTMLFIETKFTEATNILKGTYIIILDNASFSNIVNVLGDWV